ncbi:hypothetical protein FRC03_000332, partial [Tulasnella sp. 419]
DLSLTGGPYILIIKNLDASLGSDDLYYYFSPYGQIVKAGVTKCGSGASGGSGMVAFQTLKQAEHAIRALDGVKLGRKHIVVGLSQPTGSQFSQTPAEAPSSPSVFDRLLRRFRGRRATSSTPDAFAVSDQPLSFELQIENLDASIDSHYLLAHASAYGPIQAAIVQKTTKGASTGLGFIRLSRWEDAVSVLDAMNGTRLGGESIVVKMNGTKQMFFGGKNQKYPTKSLPKIEHNEQLPIGITNPIPYYEESFSDTASYLATVGEPLAESHTNDTIPATNSGEDQENHTIQLPILTYGAHARIQKTEITTNYAENLGESLHGARKNLDEEQQCYPVAGLDPLPVSEASRLPTDNDNSSDGPREGPKPNLEVYSAAFTGSLGVPMRYQELSALDSSLRRAILIGELTKRLSSMPAQIVAPHEIVDIVVWLTCLDLQEILKGIQNAMILTLQIKRARAALNMEPPKIVKSRIIPLPEDSPPRSKQLLPTASSPEPSAMEYRSDTITSPRSLIGSISLPDEAPQDASERERLLSLVSSNISVDAEIQRITALLMTLPKGERAICLFNSEFLLKKIADAKEALDSGAEFALSSYDEHVKIIQRKKDAMQKMAAELEDLRAQLANVQDTSSGSPQQVTILRPVVNMWERGSLSLAAGIKGYSNMNSVGQVLLAISETRQMIWALRPYNRGREAALECLKQLVDEANQDKARPPPSRRRRIVSWLKTAFEILGSIAV